MSPPLPERTSVGTLLLDAGGVLVRPNFGRVAEVLRRHGIPADAARLSAAEGLAKAELDVPPSPGLSTDAERGSRYFDRILEHAGIALSPATGAALRELAAWHDRENLWDEVPSGVPEGLASLRRAGLRLAVVSNANGTVRMLFRRLGWLDFFEAVLDSAVEGVEKPDPRLFRRALERLGADPATTLVVGDMVHVDVAGARAAGLRAVLVDEAGLRPDVDCPRVRSLLELARHLSPQVETPILLNSETAR